MIPAYDKYAPYIWACYGIVAVVLLLLLRLSIRRHARTRAALDMLDRQRREHGAP